MLNLTEKQKEEMRDVINESLNVAEAHWDIGGRRLAAESLRETAIFDSAGEIQPSNIPGYEFVADGETNVSQYIAYVADMRNSSQHLMCAISPKSGAKVSELQRVYYETSALLPALALTVRYEGGRVTEYLGDGVLALFKVDDDDDLEKVVYSAYYAAVNTINDTRGLINSILNERYCLPELNLGVGLGLSSAFVTLVGLRSEKQAKAFGRCVYHATKLSSGTNEIYVDKALYDAWPTSDNGSLQFSRKEKMPVDAYLVGSVSRKYR